MTGFALLIACFAAIIDGGSAFSLHHSRLMRRQIVTFASPAPPATVTITKTATVTTTKTVIKNVVDEALPERATESSEFPMWRVVLIGDEVCYIYILRFSLISFL